MDYYIIDGNNLIGRIKFLHQLQKRNKQESRIKLIQLINKYFAGKRVKISLHFDGFSNISLNVSKGKIFYSAEEASDNLIRREIESSKNPRLIVLITSDRSLMDFGKAYSCKVISSDEFNLLTEKFFEKDLETERIKQLENDKEEFLKLFQ